MTAFLAGLSDVKQIGHYARADGPEPRAAVAQRLRHGYKVVRMISDAYDAETAKAWLFGTNTRLDDEAPIEVLRTAEQPEQFRRSFAPLASWQASRSERGSSAPVPRFASLLTSMATLASPYSRDAASSVSMVQS
jgi:hypothetical protein